MKGGLTKEMVSDGGGGTLVWEICTFVPSTAGLTKEVVCHEGDLSKEVLLYSVRNSAIT